MQVRLPAARLKHRDQWIGWSSAQGALCVMVSDAVNSAVKLGDTEEWTILNKDSQYHNFRIHRTGFLVTEVNGVRTHFDGLRDTFRVPPIKNVKPGATKMIIPFTNPEWWGALCFIVTW